MPFTFITRKICHHLNKAWLFHFQTLLPDQCLAISPFVSSWRPSQGQLVGTTKSSERFLPAVLTSSITHCSCHVSMTKKAEQNLSWSPIIQPTLLRLTQESGQTLFAFAGASANSWVFGGYRTNTSTQEGNQTNEIIACFICETTRWQSWHWDHGSSPRSRNNRPYQGGTSVETDRCGGWELCCHAHLSGGRQETPRGIMSQRLYPQRRLCDSLFL